MRVTSTVLLISGASAFVVPAPPARAAARLFSAVAEPPIAATDALTSEAAPRSAAPPAFLLEAHKAARSVPTVSETLQLFSQLYSRPMLPLYRTQVVDMLQIAHLAVVDARFRYDALFAYGLREVFTTLLRAYPAPPGEVPALFNAFVTALRLEPSTVNADADSIADWVASASSPDVEAAVRGEGSGPLAAAVAKATAEEAFLFSRAWRNGLFLAAEKVGTEVTKDLVENWAERIGFGAPKANTDLEDYRNAMAKMNEAEIMFREIEIREKKRQADRLEAKAKKALEMAEKAAKLNGDAASSDAASEGDASAEPAATAEAA